MFLGGGISGCFYTWMRGRFPCTAPTDPSPAYEFAWQSLPDLASGPTSSALPTVLNAD